MSFHPRGRLPPAPEDAACIAGAASSRATPYVLLRDRLVAGGDAADAAERRPARALDAACGPDVLDRRRTDAPRVLAAMRTLNRLELAGETLRAALNAVAAAAPGWLPDAVPPDWHARHDRRVEELRRPEAAAGREAYAARIGADGHALLDALDRPETPAGLPVLPAVAALRRVWARHFERGRDGAPARRLTSGTGGPCTAAPTPHDGQNAGLGTGARTVPYHPRAPRSHGAGS